MLQKFEIAGLQCACATSAANDKIAYILYPMDMLSDWLPTASEKYGVNIVVITGMDWQNVFSPWAAPGVPKGTEAFKGESPEFLKLLQEKVVPQVEAKLGMKGDVRRSLVGVSMSGLFTLWQWMICDTFHDIASLSGSFWYEGFLDWMKSRKIPAKSGKAYFLLGDQEPKTKVKGFSTVGVNTQEIVELLRAAGIDVEFQSVPGNHYSDPIPRLDKAFTALYLNRGGDKKSELEGTGIVSEKLVEGSNAWDGSPLPAYPQGHPVVSIYKYIFPPHAVTNQHLHEVINCGVVLSGTLTIVNEDGTSHDFKAGEAFVETDGKAHHGENRGDVDAIVIMFYAGDGTTPLSTPI